MKNIKLFHLVLVISLLTFLQACKVTPPKEPLPKIHSAESFYKITTNFGSSLSHDNRYVLVSSDRNGIFNAFKVPVDGSEPTQLTNSSDSVYVIGWFPKDERILYNADQGGNELSHVYVRKLDGGIVDLTPGEGHRAVFANWHDDKRHFFIATNECNKKFFDVYRYDSKDYSRELFYQNDAKLAVESVSSDGRWIIGSVQHSNANSDLYIVDMANKNAKPRLITEHQGDVSHRSYGFSHDNKKVIYSTNEFGEFSQAWSYDIDTGKRAVAYTAYWDVSFYYESANGTYQVVGINEDSQGKLYITNTKTQSAVKIPDLPAGDLRGLTISEDESTIAFYINSDTSPSNLYVFDIAGQKVKRLTNSGNAEINESDLVAGEVVRFKSFDGLEIPGILFKPKQAAYKKVPALVWIHGGPGGQSRKGYHPLTQHLVNNGYAIFKINNRGSSGYGKTFYHLDDRKHGEDDLQDVVYNKRYLQSLDWVDENRIGVMGGSYGGYLTMAAMAFTDEFEVGINIFGVTNWVRTLESIPPYWEAFRKSLYDELGDPAVDGERLHRISPVFFGHQVKKPVLVVQGANDPRVLKIESDDMVEAIRKGGTHVEYLVFDDEGHGFTKKKNRIESSNRYLQFLDRFLGKNE